MNQRVGGPLGRLVVETSAAERFTADDYAQLFALIYKRYGYERAPTVAAIERLLRTRFGEREIEHLLTLARYGLLLGASSADGGRDERTEIHVRGDAGRSDP